MDDNQVHTGTSSPPSFTATLSSCSFPRLSSRRRSFLLHRWLDSSCSRCSSRCWILLFALPLLNFRPLLPKIPSFNPRRAIHRTSYIPCSHRPITSCKISSSSSSPFSLLLLLLLLCCSRSTRWRTRKRLAWPRKEKSIGACGSSRSLAISLLHAPAAASLSSYAPVHLRSFPAPPRSSSSSSSCCTSLPLGAHTRSSTTLRRVIRMGGGTRSSSSAASFSCRASHRRCQSPLPFSDSIRSDHPSSFLVCASTI
mmetsp:Transcript_832/g.2545  ORF Transcript_832/g.2545 Transcript_832/m.2545 type:complete len:254 (+) Transcript_832:201-962(+)